MSTHMRGRFHNTLSSLIMDNYNNRAGNFQVSSDIRTPFILILGREEVEEQLSLDRN